MKKRTTDPSCFPPIRSQKGITKLRAILEDDGQEPFTPEEYINLYTCVAHSNRPAPSFQKRQIRSGVHFCRFRRVAPS